MNLWNLYTQKGDSPMATVTTIPLKRKRIIHDYLLHFGCSPTVKGFNILADVINIAADNPTYTCKELFEEYIEEKGGYKSDTHAAWKMPYKAARRCYMNSEAGAQGVYEFVKICSVSVEDIKEV